MKTLLILFFPFLLSAQTVIINEVSQGSGSSEYVELVVVGQENEKLSVTLEEWQEINALVVKMLKQEWL